MKAVQELEADLGVRLKALFGRGPELYGFIVAERLVEGTKEEAGARELELYIASIDAFPMLGAGQSEKLVAQISTALADLLEDSPEAADLLAGRTFARAFH